MRTEIPSSNYRIPLFLISGLLLGVILTFTNLTDLTTAGVIIYGIASLGVLLYGLRIANENLIKGLIIFLTGLLSSIGIISALLMWPYAIELRLLMILPILGFLYLLFKRKLTQPEIGLLLILNVDLAIKIVQIFNG